MQAVVGFDDAALGEWEVHYKAGFRLPHDAVGTLNIPANEGGEGNSAFTDHRDGEQKGFNGTGAEAVPKTKGQRRNTA